MLVEVLPLLATAVAAGPGAWRLVRNPSPQGLSACAVLSGCLAGVVWLWYSLHEELLVSAVSSGVLLALAVGVACVWARARVVDNLRPLVGLAVLLAAGAVVYGSTGVALVLGLAPLSEVPQVLRARAGDVPALSVWASALVLVRTLPWLPYALEHRDPAIGMWAVTCSAVNVALAGALLSQRRDARRGSRRQVTAVRLPARGSRR